MTGATRLTGADRYLISRARELAGAHGPAAIREAAGASEATDLAMVYAEALGIAQHLLGELAAIIARLDGQAAAQVTEGSDG